MRPLERQPSWFATQEHEVANISRKAKVAKTIETRQEEHSARYVLKLFISARYAFRQGQSSLYGSKT